MSGEVVVTGRLGVTDFRRIASLTYEAISRAVDRTTMDLRVLNSMPEVVPYLTGRLQGSFVVSATPGQIAMKWSAIDPRTGFNYAKVQDEGNARIRGKHYGSFMLRKAKELLRKYLLVELQGMKP